MFRTVIISKTSEHISSDAVTFIKSDKIVQNQPYPAPKLKAEYISVDSGWLSWIDSYICPWNTVKEDCL